MLGDWTEQTDCIYNNVECSLEMQETVTACNTSESIHNAPISDCSASQSQRVKSAFENSGCFYSGQTERHEASQCICATSDEVSELLVEQNKESDEEIRHFESEGRRCAHMKHVFQKIKEERHPGGLGCTFMDMTLINERRIGYETQWHFLCDVCHKKTIISYFISSMKEAHDAEIRLAVKEGRVDDEGRPWITVVADGQWCKRCYRTKYDSLSGVVSIL